MKNESIKNFLKYSGIRALKTFCQSILALIPAGITIEAVDWRVVLGTAFLAAILSLCTSTITGLPELKVEDIT